MKRISLTSILYPALLYSGLAFAEDPGVLPQITVSAPQDDVAQRRDAATQKVIVGRKEIENLGVMTVGEVLGKLPGIEVKGEGQRARGMTRDGVQILVDGERPAGGSHVIAGIVGRLPAGDLERVEILRGASAEFGGAAAVTVNLVMKKAISKRGTALKLGAGVSGDQPAGQLNWTEDGGGDGFGWKLPVTLNLSRRPSQTDTARLNSSGGAVALHEQENETGARTFREFVMSPNFTWKKGRDSFSLSPLLFDGLGRTTSEMNRYAATPPGAATLAHDGSRSSTETNHRHMLRLRAEGEKMLDDIKLSGRMAWNDGHRVVDTERTSYDAVGTPSFRSEKTTSDELEKNAALRADWPVRASHLLAASIEWVGLSRDDRQVFSGTPATSSVTERQNIAWVQDDWSLTEQLTLTGGLRGEHVELSSDGNTQQRGQLLPSLAARWQPDKSWLFRSSLGAGLTMAKPQEISDSATISLGTNTPVDPDVRGNPLLRPERSVNFEAVMERYLENNTGVFGVNGYVRSTEDFVERRVRQEGARWVDRPENSGRAIHWGMELDCKVRMDDHGWKGATVKGHLTLPHARVKDTRLGVSRDARDTPDYTFSSGVEQSLPKLKSSYGVTLQISGRSVTDVPGEQYEATRARTTLDTYWLYQLNEKFKLRFNAQNLLAQESVTDVRFVDGVDVYQQQVSSAGFRAAKVTLEGRW
jgi:iron complex outermembrane receptor protein